MAHSFENIKILQDDEYFLTSEYKATLLPVAFCNQCLLIKHLNMTLIFQIYCLQPSINHNVSLFAVNALPYYNFAIIISELLVISAQKSENNVILSILRHVGSDRFDS